MYILLRFTPILSNLLVALLLLALHANPEWLKSLLGDLSFQKIGGIMIGVLVFFLFNLIFLGAGVKLKTRLRFYPFLLLLWFSGLTIFFYSDHQLLLQILMISLPLASWIWMESLFVFWQRSFAYQAYTLERIAGYLYLFVIFLYTAAISGLYTLLQVPFWIISIALLLGYFLIQYDLLLLHKIEKEKSLPFGLISSLLGFQLAVVLYLLPTHFFMYGLIVMLFYYSWNGLVIKSLKKQENQGNSYSYIVTSVLGGLLTIFTTLFLR
jgi:hypothetical protein